MSDESLAGESALAGHLHRLAVLVAAGLAPRAAWGHVAAVSADATLARVAQAVQRGGDIASAIEAAPGSPSVPGTAWRALAAAWRVATTSGAPLAPALRGFAEGLRDREAARRDIRIALAGPRATARIVLTLPGIAVLLGLLMGVDLVATLATPFGATAVGAGLVLVVIARRWMRRLLRAAEPPPPTVGLALDLLAVAAGGGGPPESAAALVVFELRRVGLLASEEPIARPEASAGPDARTEPHANTLTHPDHAALAALVRLSRATGAPLGELARADAAEARVAARAEARETAERLAVRLMLPLGACIMPSFLLLGIVPMLMGLLSSTAQVW